MRSRGRAPTLGAMAEQTRSSWAKFIPSYATVSPVYQGFFEPLQAEGRAFPYTVLTPPYERFLHRTTEKLVCEFGRQLHVLERSGSRFEVQSFPLGELSCVTIRTVLLDSEITLCGVMQSGIPACCTLRFNSITDYLFKPVVERIRLAGFDGWEPAQSAEQETFEHLVRVNYKFMNYARQSLLAGEKALYTILQPELREKVSTILGKTFYRTILSAHMSILADRELIMIGEEDRRGREDRYGGIWDYIPLNKIVALSLSRKSANLLGVTIRLPGSVCREYLYQASMEREVEQLLDHARELTA